MIIIKHIEGWCTKMTVLELYQKLSKLIENEFGDADVVVDGYMNVCREVDVDQYGEVVIQ